MRKITRVDALVQASEALANNEFKRANKILEIVDKSIAKDRRNNTYTTEIVLEKDDKRYFKFDK